MPSYFSPQGKPTPRKAEPNVQACLPSCFVSITAKCNKANSHYAKTLQANAALQLVFLGKKPKWTVVCNQSSQDAKTPRANAALELVFLGTKPKRTVARNQSSNYAKTLKGEYSAEVSLRWCET